MGIAVIGGLIDTAQFAGGFFDIELTSVEAVKDRVCVGLDGALELGLIHRARFQGNLESRHQFDRRNGLG